MASTITISWSQLLKSVLKSVHIELVECRGVGNYILHIDKKKKTYKLSRPTGQTTYVCTNLNTRFCFKIVVNNYYIDIVH